MIVFGEPSLRRTLLEFAEHYHTERNHQGVGYRIRFPDFDVAERKGGVAHRKRSGGPLTYSCYGEAA